MEDHWTDEELAYLERIERLGEAADFAIGILKHLAQEGRVHQVCGPMTTGGLGCLEKNMERFQRAIATARQNDLIVFNQIPFQNVIIRITDHHRSTRYNEAILTDFYGPIFASGLVQVLLFLPDWTTSRGAHWEYQRGLVCGLLLNDYPRHWLEPYAA